MIFCNKCYNCSKRFIVDRESDLAKAFWREHHVSYIFSCGAYYNPAVGFDEIYSGWGCRLNC